MITTPTGDIGSQAPRHPPGERPRRRGGAPRRRTRPGRSSPARSATASTSSSGRTATPTSSTGRSPARTPSSGSSRRTRARRASRSRYSGFTRAAAAAFAAHGVGHVVGVSALGRGHPRRGPRRARHGLARHGRPDRGHRRRPTGRSRTRRSWTTCCARSTRSATTGVFTDTRAAGPAAAGGRDPRYRRGRRRPAPGPVVDRRRQRPGARPRGPLARRHGPRSCPRCSGRPVRYERQPLDALATTARRPRDGRGVRPGRWST